MLFLLLEPVEAFLLQLFLLSVQLIIQKRTICKSVLQFCIWMLLIHNLYISVTTDVTC